MGDPIWKKNHKENATGGIEHKVGLRHEFKTQYTKEYRR
jgi:hypothetical protein